MPFQSKLSDYEIFEAFVERHIAEFSKFAYYVVPNYEYAQDSVQSAMESILKYYDNVRDFDEQRLFRYCLGIIKNNCLQAAAKGSKVIFMEEMTHLEAIPDDMLDNIIQEEDKAILRQCLAELPEKFKLAILMKYYYNQHDRVIAQALNISEGSVRMILTRGRAKLKKAYLEKIREDATV